jgi:hypothetical protein
VADDREATMLSHEDNELLTRTGPGTPMGGLLRRYWMPVVQSGELPAGGRVKRVQILGERLIAERCPHRGASLYFGRNEAGGMRCPYHFMDWETHRSRMYCGIPGFGVQDQAVQESQGLIVDRSVERLGTSDTAIIHVRKRLLAAARALRDRGARAPGVDVPASFCVRSASIVLPPDANWVEAITPLVAVRPDRPLILA